MTTRQIRKVSAAWRAVARGHFDRTPTLSTYWLGLCDSIDTTARLSDAVRQTLAEELDEQLDGRLWLANTPILVGFYYTAEDEREATEDREARIMLALLLAEVAESEGR
jgi:hypothetical protein